MLSVRMGISMTLPSSHMTRKRTVGVGDVLVVCVARYEEREMKRGEENGARNEYADGEMVEM